MSNSYYKAGVAPTRPYTINIIPISSVISDMQIKWNVPDSQNNQNTVSYVVTITDSSTDSKLTGWNQQHVLDNTIVVTGIQYGKYYKIEIYSFANNQLSDSALVTTFTGGILFTYSVPINTNTSGSNNTTPNSNDTSSSSSSANFPVWLIVLLVIVGCAFVGGVAYFVYRFRNNKAKQSKEINQKKIENENKNGNEDYVFA